MSTPLNASLLKGFAILGLFSDDRREITTATVSSELGLNTATAHRFLATMEQAGFLLSTDRGRYSMGLRLTELGALAHRISPVASLVQPVLETLARELDESTMACRLGRHGVVSIATAETRRAITVRVALGAVLDLHASAHGKLWLAHMDEDELARATRPEHLAKYTEATLIVPQALREELARVRETGIALNMGEREAGVAAVAVPVRAPTGGLLVTLSCYGLADRFDERFVARAAGRLKTAALEIEAQLRRAD